MAEYINKQIAIEELENLRQKYEMQDDCDELVARVCKNAIAELPSFDVAPIIHAKWENTNKEDEQMCKCSACGYPVSYFWSRTIYCPNCGAKMDKEK